MKQPKEKKNNLRRLRKSTRDLFKKKRPKNLQKRKRKRRKLKMLLLRPQETLHKQR